jgi:DNA adenine methylase
MKNDINLNTEIKELTSILPIMKWAGGKRKVLPFIKPLLPERFKKYVEPFIGGGAVLFDLVPSHAIVNDINSELMALYEVVRDSPEDLIRELNKFENTEESFYEIRSWDRNESILLMKSKVQLAARTLFLNHTGYNGLYRVNASNQFNVPYGKYVNPRICDVERIQAMSNYVNLAKVEFYNEDYSKTIGRSSEDDFIYVDPPYAPLDKAASTFTSYTANGFGLDDLVKLRESLDAARERGANWLLSNVKTIDTLKVFPEKKYRIVEFQVSRPINANATGRGGVTEILVRPR